MRRLSVSLLLVLIGACSWWLLAHSSRWSFKKWDVALESTYRQTLNDLGVSADDIFSSLHQVKTDKSGSWVVHDVQMKPLSAAQRQALIDAYEEAGAVVMEKKDRLVIKRGARTYQEIEFVRG